MKILSVQSLALPEIKIIRFGRFADHRGYFGESFRRSEFNTLPELAFLHGVEFGQMNDSVSRPGTCRGLHFQFNPYMGKLVRTVYGRMIDTALDIRKGSPTFGNIVAYDMPASDDKDYNEWIWIPVGFAHGPFFPEPTRIEYMCSGEYSPKCEIGISPLAPDLDWRLCDAKLKILFDSLVPQSQLLSEKDKNGLSLAAWQSDPRSENFVYGKS
jgi:dTDP-4-dehydrorhamnose 3,5-epimerase